ncbi:unnamed protein product [Rhizophagus irregularis]|nr:unnamed protein product [Rhizophagus irregularis]
MKSASGDEKQVNFFVRYGMYKNRLSQNTIWSVRSRTAESGNTKIYQNRFGTESTEPKETNRLKPLNREL